MRRKCQRYDVVILSKIVPTTIVFTSIARIAFNEMYVLNAFVLMQDLYFTLASHYLPNAV